MYVTGNHDEFLRSFCEDGFKLGNIKITNEEFFFTKDGRRLLLIHGDQFDIINNYAKWLSVTGTIVYELLLYVNNGVNSIRKWFGLPYKALSNRIRRNVKLAVTHLSDFENCLTNYAKDMDCDGIICGHIHYPEFKRINDMDYYNIGDWVENCSAIVERSDGSLEVLDMEEFRQGGFGST